MGITLSTAYNDVVFTILCSSSKISGYYCCTSCSLHPSDLRLILILLQALVKVLPPLEEQRVADELEPRGKFQTSVIEHTFKLVSGDVFCVSDLINVRLNINICFDKKNVIN